MSKPYNNVRQFFETNEDTISQCGTDAIKDSLSEDEKIEESCAVMVERRTKTSLPKPPKKKSLEEEECDRWVQYIYGNARKPKQTSGKQHAPKTLISKSRSELAANKPLVRGTCEGRHVHLFLDTGAETNVVDAQLFRELQAYSRDIRLIPSSKVIKCANGSSMESLGTTFLKLGFGHVCTRARFIVVQDLFPRLIVGIRTMKQLDLIIKPNEDCAQIGKMELPFVSKVQAPSVVYEQGKVRRSICGVGSGPRNL